MKKATKFFAHVGIVFAVFLIIPAAHAIAEAATSTPDTVTISIRDNGQLVGPFTVEMSATDTPAVSITATGDTTSHDIPARSVLASLIALDASTTDFDITNLQYFSSFNSFIVNCISVPVASNSPDCYNWTYAVNGSFPSTGMDTYALQNNNTVYVIFGSQWQVSTDKSSATTDEPFTVTAQEYDPSSGLYIPASGEVVGAVQFDSNFTPIEFATSTTDSAGHATLSLPLAGAYSVGIASTGYFPNTPITISTSSPPAPVSSSGGGGSSTSGVSHSQLHIPSALAYLTSSQHTDGSFDSPFLSDWVAIAFAAADPGLAKASLRHYLLTTTPSLSSVTDYERHTMALEALGINPYSESGADYIQPIVRAFDGTQIGDTSLDNDDIFALFPLLHAGYSESDPLIQKTVSFILSRQGVGGSWDGSVDVTAAAIQSLVLVDSLPGVTSAMTKATNYLHTKQNSDGGFGLPGQGNSFSTSWVLQAIAALGESPSSWAPSSLTPQDYLAKTQQTDGGVELQSETSQTRTWATAYAIPAALGKTWDSLLQTFPRPHTPDSNVDSVSTATSTPPIATSTPLLATSTLPLVTAQSTTTATSTPVRQVKPKVKLAPVVPVIIPPQTAAVASATPDGFFSLFDHMWNNVVSFFANLL